MAELTDFSNLKIITKNQGLQPLILNKAQFYLHNQLEMQLKEQKKVRAIILKGRQQGCSTYIAARFYHKAITYSGTQVFIMTHSSEATDNLFSIVEKFHDNLDDDKKPSLSKATAKVKYFANINSGYRVGTAGSKQTGRSQTIQLLHASEVAFWSNAEEHFAGLLQTIPDLPGTEIILESTSSGLGSKFYDIWNDAILGRNEYLPIFIPWYWQEEYRKTPPPDWQASEEEKQYQSIYKLDQEQVYWLHNKTVELGSQKLFNREYPLCAADAFDNADFSKFLDGTNIIRARKENLTNIELVGARIGGCDPARFGDDETSFCMRQGREVKDIVAYKHKDTMEICGLCIKYIEQWQLDKLFIDVVGIGAGVVDRLKELGFSHKIIEVNAANVADDSERYYNKRAEMWDRMKLWFSQIPCKIPDDDKLQLDLLSLSYDYDSKGRLKIEKKSELKKRGINSPDRADALALTFAYKVADNFNNIYKYNCLSYAETNYNYDRI